MAAGAGGAAAAAAAVQHAGPAAGRSGGSSSAGGGGAAPDPRAEALRCPRCDSANTKFCYYNNYSLSQPRHFCKACKRYWTRGGTLRNVPVGGGCRKSKRSSSSATPTDANNANSKTQRRASSSSRDSNSNSGSTSPTATPSSNTTPITFANPFAGDVPPPAPIFADQAAALASLFAPPPPPPLPVFNFSPQPKTEGSAISSVAVLLAAAEPEAPTSVSESAAAAADMAPFMSLDSTGIFELGDDASAASYWNAGSCCWGTDVQDPSVYLP